MLLRVVCLLVLALSSAVWQASSQAVHRGIDLRRPDALGAEWLQLDSLRPPSQLVPERLPLDLRVEENRSRPRWLFPAIGAVVGGAVFTYLTHRACQGEDCIFPVGPPLIGVGLGALLGWGADAITRPD